MSTSPASPPPSSPTSRPPRRGRGLFCILLGGILAVPSGACAGVMVIGSMVDMLFGVGVEYVLSVILMGALFAGLPLVGGIVLIIVGLKMRKEVA